MAQISDLMTKNTISTTLNTPVIEAVQLLFRYNIKGAPVIDHDRVVVGVLRENDFIIKDINVHIPTFLTLFEEFGLYRKDKALINKDLVAISKLRVQDIINSDSPVITLTASVDEAANLFLKHPEINILPVVDDGGKLEGVLGRHDLIKLYGGGISVSPFGIVKPERQVDKDITLFLKSLNRRFIFVSKKRIRLWVIFSIVCMIAGFFIANVLLLNIEF